jgi:hypothetical protein
MYTWETESLLSFLYKNGEFGSLGKRGEERFSENVSGSIIDFLVRK